METTYILLGIIVLLLALHVWERKRFDGRERDLLNRLMSRDFGHYVDGTTRLQKKPPQRPPGMTTIDEAVDTLAEEGMLAHEKREPPAIVRVS